ncbi:MAG: CGNR zinc finger domain-containing protein [Sciscionella sp.]|nr:CGNR zinc finger domain-containing protein [Sciscionella sp.]
MDFDSHASDVVANAVRAINLLTPGHARGKAYSAEVTEAQAVAALATRSSRRAKTIPHSELVKLRDYAGKLRAIFVDVEAGRIDDACRRTNALLRQTNAVPVLARHDGEPWHLHFHTVESGWARGHAASMATGVAVVLGTPMYHRLGVCTAPACDRVFVDTSRNGTRRFCSTACQNRVKAAAFRARQRG